VSDPSRGEQIADDQTSDPTAPTPPAGPTPDIGPARGRDLVASLLNVTQWIAFDVDRDGRVLAGNDESGSLQLVEITPDGTRLRLTDLPGRCTGRYVPGRRAVIVQHDAGGNERMQLSLLDLAPPPTGPATLADLIPVVADPAHLNDLRDVTATSLVYSTNRRNEIDMDVVVRDLATGVEQTGYRGGGNVQGTSLSHDGRRVAVVLASRPARSTAIVVTGVGTTSGPIALTDPDDHAFNAAIAWTAGDDALVMASNHDREFSAVVRIPADGGPRQLLVADASHDLHPWTAPDGSAIVVATLLDGSARLAIHEADGTMRCPVDLAARSAESGFAVDQPIGLPDVAWAPDGSRFVVTLSGPADPGSLFLVDATTGGSTRLVDATKGIPAAVRHRLITPSTHRIPTADGESVPCFLYRAPDDADPAMTGACVVHIHGGPEGAAARTFMPIVQALALSGISVLTPNVRGSTGYGKRWYSMDDLGKRLDSVADLAALHDHLPTLGLDPARAALWGGSYGGYMVLAGIALQPDRWAAGVDIVGMSSLVTFLENTSGYRRQAREREYGSLEHDRDILTAASPITYLDQMRAPLFVIHGANDPRVPLSEARQLKAAYDARGLPCELRVYPDEGHGLTKRSNRLDAYPAAIDYLGRFLGRAPEGVTRQVPGGRPPHR
jgi:dipeptidyl aminopeptidase/acylaminoacyl peptidase